MNLHKFNWYITDWPETDEKQRFVLITLLKAAGFNVDDNMIEIDREIPFLCYLYDYGEKQIEEGEEFDSEYHNIVYCSTEQYLKGEHPWSDDNYRPLSWALVKAALELMIDKEVKAG